MDKITISTFQLFEMFPNAESARTYFESRLWPDDVCCPVCEVDSSMKAKVFDYLPEEPHYYVVHVDEEGREEGALTTRIWRQHPEGGLSLGDVKIGDMIDVPDDVFVD